MIFLILLLVLTALWWWWAVINPLRTGRQYEHTRDGLSTVARTSAPLRFWSTWFSGLVVAALLTFASACLTWIVAVRGWPR